MSLFFLSETYGSRPNRLALCRVVWYYLNVLEGNFGRLCEKMSVFSNTIG